MNDKRNEVREVIDKTTDRWIKILGTFAGITMFLVGAIGYLVNDKMDKSNIVLEEIRKGVNAASVISENHEGRISSNTEDVKEIRGISTDNSNRLFILEGIK